MPDWYIYMVRCRGGSLYTGIATDVPRRFAQHQKGGPAGSKYLKGRGPLALVFTKRIGTRSLALQMENRIKRLPKADKEKMIANQGYSE
jgi:putative endonuclease